MHEIFPGELRYQKLNGDQNGEDIIFNGHDLLGDGHVGTSIETPMRTDAFELSEGRKMEIIQEHFRQIMLTLGLDLSDDSLKGTPARVARMYVKEIFKGLDPANLPKASVFENKFRYNEMLVEKNISMNSTCEHHFLPVMGKAHVAYISSGKVIGLSKMNRIVDHFARRPQVQERMTVQIAAELRKVLNTEDVAVVVEAKHMCVSCRGIGDESSTTLTAEYSGRFREARVKEELMQYLRMDLKG